MNADIIQHAELPRFVRIDDIYHLPFKDREFDTVLCSHTLEHVDKPEAFYQELKRVGKEVTIVLPPVWDIGAALNIFEHKWIFLNWQLEHTELQSIFAYLVHDSCTNCLGKSYTHSRVPTSSTSPRS